MTTFYFTTHTTKAVEIKIEANNAAEAQRKLTEKIDTAALMGIQLPSAETFEITSMY